MAEPQGLEPSPVHPWQEYNPYGNTCHFPGCRLTEGEHPPSVAWEGGLQHRAGGDPHSNQGELILPGTPTDPIGALPLTDADRQALADDLGDRVARLEYVLVRLATHAPDLLPVDAFQRIAEIVRTEPYV